MVGAHRRSRSKLALAALAIGGFIVAVTQPEIGRRYIGPLFDRVEHAAGKTDLLVTYDWPRLRGCDGGTRIAMPAGGAAPSTVVVPPAEDARPAIVSAGGGAWGTGHLNLYLSGRTNAVVQVVGLVPVIFRSYTDPPDWIFEPQGGCGETYERIFTLELDKPRPALVDAGLIGELDAATTTPPREPLGSTFTVSDTDPAHIRIEALGCERSYDWGVRVEYIIGGKRRTYQVGSADKPFRSIGGTTARWYTRGANGLDPYSPGESHRCSYWLPGQ